MPSPVVHSIAGFAFNRLARGRAHETVATKPEARGRTRLEQLFFLGAFIFAGNAADLDFIPGILIGEPGRFHHGPAHSLSAAVLFGLVAGLLAHRFGLRSARRFGLFMGLAFTSHLLLDMLSTENGVRHGVALFWPLYDQSLVLPFPVFQDISHDSVPGSFFQSLLLRQNAYAILWELVVVGVVLVVVRFGSLVFSDKWRRARGARQTRLRQAPRH